MYVINIWHHRFFEFFLYNRWYIFWYIRFLVLNTTRFIIFFQAEDGIRDFCLSRGLGDVYKRQVKKVKKKKKEEVEVIEDDEIPVDEEPDDPDEDDDDPGEDGEMDVEVDEDIEDEQPPEDVYISDGDD